MTYEKNCFSESMRETVNIIGEKHDEEAMMLF